jgi:hypothetical protein
MHLLISSSKWSCQDRDSDRHLTTELCAYASRKMGKYANRH